MAIAAASEDWLASPAGGVGSDRISDMARCLAPHDRPAPAHRLGHLHLIERCQGLALRTGVGDRAAGEKGSSGGGHFNLWRVRGAATAPAAMRRKFRFFDSEQKPEARQGLEQKILIVLIFENQNRAAKIKFGRQKSNSAATVSDAGNT